jgi:hypothetical protein
MKIQLSEKVFLESDSMQFIIKKYTGNIDPKTEKETSVNLGYFSNFKSALKFILKMDLLSYEITSFSDVIKVVEGVEKKIDNILAEVKP